MYVYSYIHAESWMISYHRIVVDHSCFLLSLHGHKPRNHQHCLRSSICRQHQEDPGNRGELAHSKPISALRSHVTGNTISLGHQHKWNKHMNVLSMFAVFCSFFLLTLWHVLPYASICLPLHQLRPWQEPWDSNLEPLGSSESVLLQPREISHGPPETAHMKVVPP
jgi:hypothetical protein